MTKQLYLSNRNRLLNLSYRYAQEHPNETPNQYDRALADLYVEARKNGVILPEHGEFVPDAKTMKLMEKLRNMGK